MKHELVYIVRNDKGEMVKFSYPNPIKSRERAIQELKLFRRESKSYQGLKLSLSMNGQILEIITGKRINSKEILKSLADECELLAKLDLPYDMEACFNDFDGTKYLTVSDDLVYLYYFTIN